MTYGTPLDETIMPEWEAREQICEIGKRLWDRQYVEANGGNMTYRLDSNRILATPTMISKGFMKPEDLVILDYDGNQLSGKRGKTSEILVHLQILRNRPDIRSVIHSHPPHATAFAIVGNALPKCVHPELEIFLGEVPIAPYQTPGTQKVADSLNPYLKDFKVWLLASHGAVAAGVGLLEAYWNTEIVEAYCRLIILSRSIGEPSQLNHKQMAELLQIKENMGIPDRRNEPGTDAACDAPIPGAGDPGPSPPPNGSGLNGVDPDLIRRVTEAVVKKLGAGA